MNQVANSPQLSAEQAATQASLYCQLITGQENPIVNVLFMPDSENPSNSPEHTVYHYSKFGYSHDLLREAYHQQSQGYTPHLLLQETYVESARKKDITGCRTWVLDIDTPVSEQELIALCQRIRPSFVVSTSPGKYHLYYLCVHGDRFHQIRGMRRPEDRYANWIAGAKALISTAKEMGIDVDTNYTQLTKRCRIPGYLRRTKDGQEFTPQIIWASSVSTDTVTRYSFNSLVNLIGKEYFSAKVGEFDRACREERDKRRAASREAVRASGIPEGRLSSGGFDFSQLTSIIDLTDAELASTGYPAVTTGSRNDTLFSYMYNLFMVVADRLAIPEGGYTADELITLGVNIAKECNDKHAVPLEESELDNLVASAFEYCLSRILDRQNKKKATRDEVVSTPVPEVVVENYPKPTPSSEAGSTPSTTVEVIGQVPAYDYSAIDPAAPFSDDAMATRIIQRFGEVIKRIGDSGQIAVFTGTKWDAGRTHKEVGLSSMYQRVIADVPFDEYFAGFVADKDGNPSRGKVERLMESLQSEYRYKRITACLSRSPHIASIPTEDFLEQPHILNCLNGVLDLSSGELYPHAPHYFSKSVASVSYNAQASCPTWDDYLQSAFGSGPDGDRLRDYVQRLCGYLISGHMNEQVMALLYGQGSNGKSVLTQTLYRLLGEYAGVGDESDFGAGKKGGLGTGKLSERVMAKFVGKRLVLGSEFSKDTRLKEEAVKRITGQDIATARYLYGEAFKVIPTFKVVIGTNHLPYVEDDSIALWRRVHIVPFTYSFFSEEERTQYKNRVPADVMRTKVSGLEELLKAELPGILCWCQQGYQMWMERGLTDQPEIMKQELATAQFDNNMTQAVLSECVVDLEEDDTSAGMTTTEICNEIKREIAGATGQAAQDISISVRKVGAYLKQVRRLKKESVKFSDGRVLKLYRVKLDFSRVPMLDN